MATVMRRRRDEDAKAPSADRYRSNTGDVDDTDDDDDEDESPRARRRRERDDEPVSRRSRRALDDDDDDVAVDEPRTRRAARDDDDDDDDDEPLARRARRSDADDDDEPPARGRRAAARDKDDDDDDPPARPSGGSGGWDSWGKKRRALGNFANELRVPDDGTQTLIKFLDDAPFCTYALHWLQLPQGRRPFVCLEKGCPLCDRLGDTAKAMAAFNILVLDESSDPKLMVWAASTGVVQQIEVKANAKTGPLTKEYYSVSKTKAGRSSKGPVQYSLDVVKTRDLREDWGLKPLTDAQLDTYESQMYDEARFLKRPTKVELKAVVREVMDEDD